MTGVDRIAAERRRQIEEEGWSAEHDDDEHQDGELAMAAACYAAPERIYVERDHATGRSYDDPFPWEGWDKRYDYGECRTNPGNVPPEPGTYTTEEQIDLLVKAGALIAAEIDRLLRMTKNAPEPP